MRTVLVFGDQLNRDLGALATADPDLDRVLLVESAGLMARGGHRQRVHLVVTAMHRFADELRVRGHEVDLRQAPTLADGVQAHVDEHAPDEVVATEPNSRAARAMCERLGVQQVRSNQFLCHHDDFADWADGRRSLRMEDFYRWRRRETGLLMDGDEPVGGRWNLDHDNREPPPEDDPFPTPVTSELDDLDREVLARIPPEAPGSDPTGLWPTSRRRALARLRHFVDDVLPLFGPYEDAMTTRSWHLGHSLLSPALNLGLLHPEECVRAVEDAHHAGGVPLSSAEGFIRQVIGWREYVWGLYWLWPDHEAQNVYGHDEDVPAPFRGQPTDMACVHDALSGLHERGWVHHIQRLMVLANLANLHGTDPSRLVRWMWDQYVDGFEWVMIPNVVGMATWSDGGRMATKPYVSGGAYLKRMSTYCEDCRFDPGARVGEDACPFTTLYWDFMDRHRGLLGDSHRMGRPLATLDRLGDLDDVRDRAAQVHVWLRDGEPSVQLRARP